MYEINLRKARKLEQKIQAFVDSMKIESSIKVRAMSSSQDRKDALNQARMNLLADGQKQRDLIKARFSIRNLIGKANQDTGINDLMNQREMLQALLAKSSAKVETVNLNEIDDEASYRQNQITKGERGYGDTVTFTSPVATQSDLELFKREDQSVKNQLEDVEDQLSQKNLGAVVTLDDDTVSLLQANGLL